MKPLGALMILAGILAFYIAIKHPAPTPTSNSGKPA